MRFDFRFQKYHGCGNDFIIIDEMRGRRTPDMHRGKIAQRLCNRHLQVGADGVIFVERAPGVHGSMRLFEPAGNEADMCGNGLRCVAAYLTEKLKRKNVDILTRDGIKRVSRKGKEYIADMGIVRTMRKDLGHYLSDTGNPQDSMLRFSLDCHDRKLDCSILNSGEPHIVVATDDLDAVDLVAIGEEVNSQRRRFPHGVNLNFLEVTGPHEISVRTYERGVYDETLACGTGVTACSAAASLLGLVDKGTVTVRTTGGTIRIDLDDSGRALMTGPAVKVFEGRVRVEV
ncbi:MAG TPA: diaminopimelate epimerase [Thermoplasmata archaeon]